MNHKEQQIAAFASYVKSLTDKKLLKELVSWHKYMTKYDKAYTWHNYNLDEMQDGDRVLILKKEAKQRKLEA